MARTSSSPNWAGGEADNGNPEQEGSWHRRPGTVGAESGGPRLAWVSGRSGCGGGFVQDSVRSRSQQPCSLLGAANRRNGRNRSKGGSGERQGRPGGGRQGEDGLPGKGVTFQGPAEPPGILGAAWSSSVFGFLDGLQQPSQAAQRAEATSGCAARRKDPHCGGLPSASTAELVPGHRGLEVLRWELAQDNRGSMALAVQPEAFRVYPGSMEL